MPSLQQVFKLEERAKRAPNCNLIATVTGDHDDLNTLVSGGLGKEKPRY